MNAEPAAPWSREAEIAVLGAMLIDADAARSALERLDVEDFHLEGHRRIFGAFGRLNGRGRSGDVVLLSEELKSAGELEAAGGMGYLAELVDAVPSAVTLDAHAGRLRELRALRVLYETTEQARGWISEAGPGEAGELVAATLERLRDAEQFAADTEAGATVHDYADLASDPELTAPPDAVVPRLAFREHLTLLSSDAKGGKTTLAAAGAAAVANGVRFLGRPTRQGRVLWVRGEGHLRMVLKYLQDFQAEPVRDRIFVAESGFDPVGELETLVERHSPDLVVIDTWTSWTATLGLDYWRAADVAPVLKRLEAVARSGPAVLLLHHNRRSDQQPRGSGHLMAAVDLLRTVEDGSHDRERKVAGRGRIPCPPFRYRLTTDGDNYELKVVDPEREIEERVLTYIEANPACSKSNIRSKVEGRNDDIDAAVKALERTGLIEVDRSGVAHRHRIAQDPHRHGTGTVGARSRHGSGRDRAREGGGLSIDKPPSGRGRSNAETDRGEESTPSEHRCERCGTRIGPTADVCAGCKYGDGEAADAS